jgi:hypothetical protein
MLRFRHGWQGYWMVLGLVLLVGCDEIANQVKSAVQGGADAKQAAEVESVEPSSPDAEIAAEFAKRAAADKSADALNMIDRQRFTDRLMGPHGSYEAQAFELSADQLLTMIGGYPLDGTTTFHNRRLWKVLGESSHQGQRGIVLRYYSEPRSAIQVFANPERCQQAAKLLPFSEFEQLAGNLFAATERTAGPINGIGGEIKLDTQVVPKSLGILPTRVGYLLLLVDDASGTPVIYDFVDLLTQQPLSSTAGAAYRHEWTLHSAHGKVQPGLERTTATFFGPIPLGIGELTGMGDYEDLRMRNGANGQPPSKFGDRSDVRAIRLFEVAKSVQFTPAETAALVQQFKADFPGDSGADLAVVIEALIWDKLSIPPQAAGQVRDSAAALHALYHDPFLLAVEGLAENARDAHDAAREKLTAAHQGGFESVSTHEFFIVDALRRGDAQGLKTAVANLAKFWGNENATRNDEVYTKYAGRWRRYEASPEHKESASSDGPPPHRGPAGPSGRNPGPRGGRMGPSSFDSPQFGGDRPSARPAPTFGTTPSTGPGNRPPRRPTDPAAQVTIKLKIEGKFDLRDSVQRLREKLGNPGHNASTGGKSGSITLHYSGAVRDVVAAIDFGKVTSVDEQERVIHVTIE